MPKIDQGPSVLIITSREDYQQAKKLSQQLKRYRVPKSLIGQINRDGKVAANIEELHISLDQPFDSESTCLNARYAVVLCSPAAVDSSEVDQWARAYKQKHSSSQVLCYILSGEPNAADMPNTELKEAFPDSVKFLVDDNGELSEQRTEPIAADSRKHADGPGNAKLKLLAGIHAVGYEQLKQRAKRRRTQQVVAFSLLLLLLLAYGASLLWQQRTEELAKQRIEYQSLIQQSFAALNKQSPQAMSLYQQAQSRFDNSIDDTGLLASLKFRLSHEQLSKSHISKDPKIQFLLKSVVDPSRKLDPKAYAIGLHSGVLVLIDKDQNRYEFKLDVARWSNGYYDGVAEIRAIEIVNNASVWLIVGRDKVWKLLRLNLNDLSIDSFAEQSAGLIRATEFPEIYKGFRRNLNLKRGQVLVLRDNELGIYDALNEQTYFTKLPAAISHDDIGYDIYLGWNRSQQRLFVFDKNKAAYQSAYTQQAEFNTFHSGPFSSSLVSEQSDWVAINETSASYDYTSQLYRLSDARHLTVENNHTVHLQEQQHQQLRLLLKGIDGSTKEDLSLNIQTGETLIRRRIDWQLPKPGNGQYYSDNGVLYRQSADFIATINQWPVECEDNTGLYAEGQWQCLENTHWVGYPVDAQSPQSASTLKGYVRKYREAENQNLWAITNQDVGRLSVWSANGAQLSLLKEFSPLNKCYLDLHLPANDLAYVTVSEPEPPMIVGGACSAQTPFEATAHHLSTASPAVERIDRGITNLQLAVGKGIYRPNYHIDGIHQDLSNLNGYSKQNGDYNPHSASAESIELSDNATVVFVSQNPLTAEMAITEYINESEGESASMSLSLLDASGKRKGDAMVSQKVNQNTFAKAMMQHGFSADGRLFWWSYFGENETINWQSLGGSELPPVLPRQFNSGLDYLVFSQSQRFLLLASPLTSGRHTVYDLEKQSIAFKASLTANYLPNFDNVAFHQKQPWLLFNAKAISLDDTHAIANINYSGEIQLTAFHPEKPWAAGVCDQQHICIADLIQGQIIFHLRLPKVYNSLEKTPQQVTFSKDGKRLLYLLGGRTLLSHDLML